MDDDDRWERAEAMERQQDRLDDERAVFEAKIASLRAALFEAVALIEGTVISESQHDDYRDDPDWKAALRFRAIATEGA